MYSSNEEAFIINGIDDYIKLISILDDNNFVAKKVIFENHEYRNKFLTYCNIDIDKFDENYFVYKADKRLHISESEHGYIWISNGGLVGQTRRSSNNFVNSFRSQYIVVTLLLEKVLTICEDETIYDVDTFNYEFLGDITPALFHNVLFFFELFGKSYLTLHGYKVKNTHKLSCIFKECKARMFDLNHNNTLLNAHIFHVFENYVDYIDSIPGKFKEQFVKYQDNEEDGTVVVFDIQLLREVRDSIVMSYDFIENCEYNSVNNFYIKDGFFERILDKAESLEDKNKVKSMYGYILMKND